MEGAKLPQVRKKLEMACVRLTLSEQAEEKFKAFSEGVLKFGKPAMLCRTIVATGKTDESVGPQTVHLCHPMFASVLARKTDLKADVVSEAERPKAVVETETETDRENEPKPCIFVYLLRLQNGETDESIISYVTKNTKRSMRPNELVTVTEDRGRPSQTDANEAVVSYVLWPVPEKLLSCVYFKTDGASTRASVRRFGITMETVVRGDTGTGAQLSHVQNEDSWFGAYWNLSGPRSSVNAFLSACRHHKDQLLELTVAGDQYEDVRTMVEAAHDARPDAVTVQYHLRV